MNNIFQPVGVGHFLKKSILTICLLIICQGLLFAQSKTLKAHALNGLAIDINDSADAELWASELNCGSYDFTSEICEFRIGVPSRGKGQIEPPATERWVFTCEDAARLGANIRVDFWVKNCNDQWTYVTTNVLLEDLKNTCNSIPTTIAVAEKASTASTELDAKVAVEKSENEAEIPAFELYQNQPNPFKTETLIGFSMSDNNSATLKIYDLSGRVLKTISSNFPKGYNEVAINRSEFSATGTLFYTLETKTFSMTKKMILVE